MKLTTLHIHIIGVVVALLVGAGLYFTIITGALEAKKKAESELAEVQARADKLPMATRALEQAKKEKEQAEQEWSVFERQYMPVIGYQKDTLTTWLRVFIPNRGRSWPERFIRTVRQHMERENKANGIVWENPGTLVLPAYGPDPNRIDVGQPGQGFGPVLTYSYQMAVRAPSLDKLMNHIKSWSSLAQAGVPVVDGLQISGNSPELRATYNVTFTIIVRDQLPAPVPRISGSGGGMGGGPMGMGPMGMMGGMMGGMTSPGATSMGMTAPGGMGSGGPVGPPSFAGPMGAGGGPPRGGGGAGGGGVLGTAAD